MKLLKSSSGPKSGQTDIIAITKELEQFIKKEIVETMT